MEDRVRSYLVGFSGFLVTLFVISVARHYFRFRKLCIVDQGVPKDFSIVPISSCPTIPEIFLLTLIDPRFVLISVVLGSLAGYVYWKEYHKTYNFEV
jgi:hypothetical protein